MPTLTVKFDLPEEREDFEEFQNGPRYRHVLAEVWNKVRNKTKYGEGGPSEGELKAYHQVRDWIGEACRDEDLEVP